MKYVERPTAVLVVRGRSFAVSELLSKNPEERVDFIRSFCAPDVPLPVDLCPEKSEAVAVDPEYPKFRYQTKDIRHEIEFRQAIWLNARGGKRPVFSAEDLDIYNSHMAAKLRATTPASDEEAAEAMNSFLREVWIRLAKACVDAATAAPEATAAVSEAATDKTRFSEAAEWLVEQIEGGMKGVIKSEILLILRSQEGINLNIHPNPKNK
jgi:hypothetical protein